MPVSKKTIKELQEIIREEYGHNLDFEEVAKIASDVIGYFYLLPKLINSV